MKGDEQRPLFGCGDPTEEKKRKFVHVYMRYSSGAKLGWSWKKVRCLLASTDTITNAMQECEKELNIVSDGAVQVYDENSFRFARDMLEQPLLISFPSRSCDQLASEPRYTECAGVDMSTHVELS